jgi:hypothetical protein
MKMIFNCTFEVEITPKKNDQDNRPYRVTDSIQTEAFTIPTKRDIEVLILEDWKQKNKSNHRIVEIYTPERLD